jgi:hypothetical protein
MVSRIYHSREDRLSDLHADKERVQYDKDDLERIDDFSVIVDEYADELCSALEGYIEAIEAPVDEDTESRVSYARREVIEKWALMQGAVSKVAWGLRFDGNQAYERMIDAMKAGAAMDMRGL